MHTVKDKKENIQKVLKIALEYCQEVGIENITKVELARRANLSTKSIQRYFINKADLIFKISDELLTSWYMDIHNNFIKSKQPNMLGIDLLKTFLIVQHTYLLNNYLELLFIQEANIHCRHNLELENKYWYQFRKADSFVHAVQYFVDIGIKDHSINEDVMKSYPPETIAMLSSGFVEHLAMYIDSKEVTVNKAVEMSNNWVEQLLIFLKNK